MQPIQANQALLELLNTIVRGKIASYITFFPFHIPFSDKLREKPLFCNSQRQTGLHHPKKNGGAACEEESPKHLQNFFFSSPIPRLVHQVNSSISTPRLNYPNPGRRHWRCLSLLIPMLQPSRWMGLMQKKWISHFR